MRLSKYEKYLDVSKNVKKPYEVSFSLGIVSNSLEACSRVLKMSGKIRGSLKHAH